MVNVSMAALCSVTTSTRQPEPAAMATTRSLSANKLGAEFDGIRAEPLPLVQKKRRKAKKRYGFDVAVDCVHARRTINNGLRSHEVAWTRGDY